MNNKGLLRTTNRALAGHHICTGQPVDMRLLRIAARLLWVPLGSSLVLGACAKGAGSDGEDGDDSTSTSTSSLTSTGPTSGEGTGTFDGASSVAATSGAGGSDVTATTGAGGDPSVTVSTASVAASSNAVASSSSSASASAGSGGAPPDCGHDVCSEGGPLLASCDSCSGAVCAADPYCCSTAWDPLCVSATGKLCADDPCGLVGGSSSSSATGGGGGSVLPGDLLITEVMNDPAKVEDTKGEWFEVHNPTASPIELKGLVLRHQQIAVDPSAIETIAKSVVVPAGGFVVLGNNGDATTNGGVKVDYVYSSKITLNNSKDFVGLETADATLIDGTTYDTAKLKVTGKTRSLDPGAMTMSANDTDTNFCAAKTLIAGSTDYGTPGKANDSCK